MALVGEALYGSRWQTELARSLGVTDRTMRRWVAGADELREDVVDALRKRVEHRLVRLRTVAEELAAQVGG